jgi:hypothetical protein
VSTPNWSIECDYMESCNCDFGCTCNFSGIPTSGRCEALVGYHVRKGNFGNVSLDGLDFIYAASLVRRLPVVSLLRLIDSRRDNACAPIAIG